MKYLLSDILKEYSEKNSLNKYYPVAVGKYGIRKRSDIYKKELAKDYSKNKVIRKNTLIVGMGSTQIDIGVLSSDEIFSVSPAYHTFNISDKIVDSRYLDLLFLSKNNEYTQKYMIASARQGKTVNLKDLLKEIIEIPNFEQQYEIINKIEKIKKFIQFEEENISYYEELIKSRFIEMFGDPIYNSKQWKIKYISEIGSLKNGMNFSNEKNKIDIKCLGVGDFKNHSVINTSDLSYISLDELPNNEYLLKNNDIIFVRSNGNKNLVGRCVTIFPNEENITFSGFCIRLRISDKSINTQYLLRLLKDEGVKEQLRGRGANIQNLNQQILSKLQVPVPPIELQNKFAEFVQLIDKLKFIAQKRIDLYTELLNKKMDEYFN